jgi:monovalent cation/hydrogen antiporter
VILVTLVLQGLSLPFVVRLLGMDYDGVDEHEEIEARQQTTQAALEKIEELKGEEWVHKDIAERMRELYEHRRSRFSARYPGWHENGEEDGYEEHSLSYQRFRREILGEERAALLRLRSEGRISDKVLRRIERDLDLEEARLEP